MLVENDLRSCLHKRRLPRRDALLLILSVGAETPKNVQRIKRLGRDAGVTEIQRWNVSDILRKAKSLAIRLPQGWALTMDGKQLVKSFDVFPQTKSVRIINTAHELRAATSKITDSDTVRFLSEAIACFEAGLYRACVVLSWAGAVALLYKHVIDKHLAPFNAEVQRRDPKWKPPVIADDLARMKESEFLDVIASPPLSIIGKNVKEELKNSSLQLRNACGHPSSLVIGENKVAAHLETLILNVYRRFS